MRSPNKYLSELEKAEDKYLSDNVNRGMDKDNIPLPVPVHTKKEELQINIGSSLGNK